MSSTSFTIRSALIVLVSLTIISCGPSKKVPPRVQTAIAQTVAAAPTFTPMPTVTPIPSPTLEPQTPTPTALQMAYLTLEELQIVLGDLGTVWEAPVERDCVYKIRAEENECLVALYESYAEGVDSPMFTQFTRFKSPDIAERVSQALMKNFGSGGIILDPAIELSQPENPWFVQYTSNVIIMGWVQESVLVTITHPIINNLEAKAVAALLYTVSQVQYGKLKLLGF